MIPAGNRACHDAAPHSGPEAVIAQSSPVGVVLKLERRFVKRVEHPNRVCFLFLCGFTSDFQHQRAISTRPREINLAPSDTDLSLGAVWRDSLVVQVSLCRLQRNPPRGSSDQQKESDSLIV